MSWVDDKVSDYYQWLKSRTSVRSIEQTEWSVISTPFLGAYNDPLDIYVRRVGDKIEFSDDGVVMENLSQQGVFVQRSAKRKEILSYILINYGVELIGDELHLLVPFDKFTQAKHNMLCAMTEVSDMAFLAQSNVSNIFRDEVKAFFDELQLIYTPQFIIKGSTGLDFTFDFQFAGRTKETVVKSFSSLNKINVPHFLFTWQDVKESRELTSGKKINGLAIINDSVTKIKPDYLSAMSKKGCEHLLWSQRHSNESEELLNGLVA